jgi:hypothetical protein
MSPSHTPGPWAYEQESDNSTDFWVFQAHGPARVAVEVSERDAALIAAAPELLAALQAIAVMTDEDPGTFRKRGGTYRGLVGEIARAAIARATGQA